MVADDVTEELLIALLIIVYDGPAAGQFHAREDNRNAVRLGVGNEFPDQAVVMEAVADDDQRVKQMELYRPVSGAGDLVLALVPVKIKGRIEHNQTVTGLSGDAAEFVQETRIQKIMYLRKADGYQFLSVSHSRRHSS